MGLRRLPGNVVRLPASGPQAIVRGEVVALSGVTNEVVADVTRELERLRREELR